MRWLALLVLSGCALHPRPIYVPLDLPLPEAPRDGGDEVRRSVAWAMERGRMPHLRWASSAASPPRDLAPDELDAVPPEVLWAAWVCSPRRMWGSELDLLLTGANPLRPVTLQVDTDGGVTLTQGEPWTDAPDHVGDRAERMAEIARRHGLAAVRDGSRSWADHELAALEQALGMLDPRELSLMRGVALSRDGTSTRDPRELALYDPMAKPVVIHAFDGAFAAAQWSFVGPVDRPQPAPVMTLVHEFGHVISDAPITAAWTTYERQLQTSRQAPPEDAKLQSELLKHATRDLRRVGRRGPVIHDYAELRHRKLWPTAWSTDVFESFAEAFALYKTDPDALLRVAPEAHAWFAADGHLAWRRFPG